MYFCTKILYRWYKKNRYIPVIGTKNRYIPVIGTTGTQNRYIPIFCTGGMKNRYKMFFRYRWCKKNRYKKFFLYQWYDKPVSPYLDNHSELQIVLTHFYVITKYLGSTGVVSYFYQETSSRPISVLTNTCKEY
jgi:hypothetical protein